MDDPAEEWKPVVGYEGLYEVSNHGRVRSIVTKYGTARTRLLKPRADRNGYMRANLCKGDGPRDHYVHALVLAAFEGECPEGWVRNHKNGVKNDNRHCNLEYVTRSGNARHAAEHGLLPRGSDHKNSKLTAEQVKEIRENPDGLGPYQLERRYGVNRAVIRRIWRKETWKHVA